MEEAEGTQNENNIIEKFLSKKNNPLTVNIELNTRKNYWKCYGKYENETYAIGIPEKINGRDWKRLKYLQYLV